MWPNPQETADLLTFTEKILNRKLNFLYSVNRPALVFSLNEMPKWFFDLKEECVVSFRRYLIFAFQLFHNFHNFGGSSDN